MEILGALWKSPWTVWVGFRYLRSKKSSKFLSFITILSVLGVMLGVTAMIVVLSVMDGFEDELRKRFMGTELHLLIQPEAGFVSSDALSQTAAGKKLLSDPGTEAVWPMISTEAILRTGRKVKGLMIKGVNEAKLTNMKSQMTEQASPEMLVEPMGHDRVRQPGLFIGQELAYELGAIPGDFVTLISPTELEGPMGQIPRMKRFVIEGIYRSGLPDQELQVAFTRDVNVQNFIRKKEIVNSWEVALKDFEKAPSVAASLKKELPGFKVQHWIELNSSLFASLRLERLAMFIVLAFIIVVASFNIVTTLTLMVLEKKKEISILKAMGAKHEEVGAIFLAEGLWIGSVGTILGLIVSFLICVILRKYEFIALPDIYYDRNLPVTFDPYYYVGVGICAFMIVLGACVYPSLRASRLDPISGIRTG